MDNNDYKKNNPDWEPSEFAKDERTYESPYTASQGSQPTYQGGQYNSQPAYNGGSQSSDNGGFGWGLLGFCVPLAGLVLYLVWKDEKPRTAKAAGKGALISVIAGVAMYVLMILVGVLAAMSSF